MVVAASDRRIIYMQIASIGIDLGKTTFHLVALGPAGQVLVRRKFSEKQLLTYMANLGSFLVGLEACSGAHFLGRALRSQGHDVRLIPAQFVKPFVKSNKNDFLDAEAIAEAVARQNMRFVPIKTDDQLDLQAIHRVRDRLIACRTAVINQLRAFLLERGMTFAKSPAKLKLAMPEILENADSNLTPRMRNLVADLWTESKSLDQQIRASDLEVEQIRAIRRRQAKPSTRSLRQIFALSRFRAAFSPSLFRATDRISRQRPASKDFSLRSSGFSASTTFIWSRPQSSTRHGTAS